VKHCIVQNRYTLSRGIISNETDENKNQISYSPSKIKEVFFTIDSTRYRPVPFKYTSRDSIEYDELHLAEVLYEGFSKLYRIDLSFDDETRIYDYYDKTGMESQTNSIVYILQKDSSYYNLRKIESQEIKKNIDIAYHLDVESYKKTKEEYKGVLLYLYRDKEGALDKINTLEFSDLALANFISWADGCGTKDTEKPTQTNNITVRTREKRIFAYSSGIMYHDKDRSVTGLYGYQAGLGFEIFKKGNSKKFAFLGKAGIGNFAPFNKDSSFNDPFYANKDYAPIYLQVSLGGNFYLTRKSVQPHISIEGCYDGSTIHTISSLKFKYGAGIIYKNISLSLLARFNHSYYNYQLISNGPYVMWDSSLYYYHTFEMQLAYIFNKKNN